MTDCGGHSWCCRSSPGLWQVTKPAALHAVDDGDVILLCVSADKQNYVAIADLISATSSPYSAWRQK